MQSTPITNRKNIFDISISRINSERNGATVIIPHVCNNVGLFGAGFALDLRNRFPEVATNFELLGKKTKLGYVQYIEVMKNKNYQHKLYVANMIAQNKIISHNNKRPLNYEYLVKCMIDVRNHIYDLNLEQVEIHCPKFGSGLAGGNWLFIQHLIDDIWHNIPVMVYQK